MYIAPRASGTRHPGVKLKNRGDGAFEVSSDPQGSAKKLIESLFIVVGNAASDVIEQ